MTQILIKKKNNLLAKVPIFYYIGKIFMYFRSIYHATTFKTSQPNVLMQDTIQIFVEEKLWFKQICTKLIDNTDFIFLAVDYHNFFILKFPKLEHKKKMIPIYEGD